MRALPWMALLIAAACGERQNLAADAQSRQQEATTSAAAGHDAGPARRASAGADVPTIVFVGTSLTAGLGLPQHQAYPAVVERLARADGLAIAVVNAGLSGETSAGALRRLDWVLRAPADVVVIETGANDGLRALDVDATRANLAAIVARVRELQPEARVALVQMEAPPNFGAAYTTRFSAMYREVAAATGATLLPFLLDGVATVPEMNQPDGIHPNATGAARVAANVWRALRPVVEGLESGG